MDNNPNISDSNDILIIRFLADEATPEETDSLWKWIETSDENRRYFLKCRNVWDALNPAFLSNSIDIENAEKQIMSRIHKENKVSGLRIWWKRLSRIWQQVAAALIIPIAACAIYFAWHNSKNDVPDIPYVSISTAYGSTSSTTLPDGSKVWLNSNSSITYPREFNSDQRTVTLVGEAYFQVEADKKHPFVVYVDGIDVTATGTQFNVNAYPGTKEKVSVTLVEGKVNVNVADKGSYDLTPGDHLVNQNGDVEISCSTPTDKYCAWRDGVLDFKGDTLQDILNRLQQIYPVRFVVEDPSVAAYHFHAEFKDESLEEILHLLELSSPIKITITQDSVSPGISVVHMARN